MNMNTNINIHSQVIELQQINKEFENYRESVVHFYNS
jgi:hypothetical protein